MFLSVKQAECAVVLQRLTQMLQDTLAYMASTTTRPLDFPELMEQLDPELRYLMNRKKVKNALLEMSSLSPMECMTLYLAFCNDIDFTHHIDDATYAMSTLSGTSQTTLKNLCSGLYDSICNGGSHTSSFSIKELKKQYMAANGRIGRICPVCRREILFDCSEGEADHYFPKSSYPTLALHPYNIVPICGDCNGPSNKHKQPPINQLDRGCGELRTVFLPYLRAAEADVDVGIGDRCRITICPKADASVHTTRRLENMDRIYKLEDRWSKVLDDVCGDILQEVRDSIAAGQSREVKLSLLRNILLSYAKNTKNRTGFIKGIYCAWLQEKSDIELEKSFLSPILMAP